MKILEMTKAKGDLASYAEQVRGEPVVVTDRGRPVMALVPIENADLETVTLSSNAARGDVDELLKERRRVGSGPDRAYSDAKMDGERR